jgi:uncharacterized protein
MSKIVIGENKFTTLIAITEKEHMQGLMYQPFPPPIMSFPYKVAKPRKFWMLNTVSPLDIIFCRAGEVIGIYDGVPHSRELVGSDEPTDLVIELPKGYAEKFSVNTKTKVKLIYSIDSLAKYFQVSMLKSGDLAD